MSTPNQFRIQADFAIQATAEGDAPTQPTFEIEAYSGGAIRQYWSKYPMVVDLAGMVAQTPMPLLYGHSGDGGFTGQPLDGVLGQIVRAEATQRLRVAGDMLGEGQTYERVISLSRKGMKFQASIGADVGRTEFVEAGQTVTVNGRQFTGPISVVRSSTLREVSIVLMGADPNTSAAIAAQATSGGVPMADNANQTPDVAAATPEAPAVVAGGAPPAPVDRTDEILARFDALTKKVDSMEKLQATRDARPAGPAVHVVEHAAPSAEVVQASFAMQGGLPGVEKLYDAKTLEAAHKARNQISLSEVILQAAVTNGYDGPRKVSSSTLRPILAAAWATHSISGILSATVNKFLLAGFDGVESAWRSISAVRSVNDFKALTSYRLNGGFKFEKVGNGGELDKAGASDESRTISADTYGIMTSVTRTDLINDDLGALTAVPQRIGRGGALKLNDVFWASFLDDASFFTTARKNLMTSGTSPAAAALSLASLKTVVTTFKKLKDPDGNPLAVTPQILLVPVDAEITALEIMGSSLIQSGATTGQPERNVLAGRYQVVASTYLTNTTDYYLLASPADLPVMEVAFLNGVQSPIVETAEADFNTLGVQMRGYFDFGVAKAEYLAGVKVDV